MAALFLLLGLILTACAGYPAQAAIAAFVLCILIGWAEGAK